MGREEAAVASHVVTVCRFEDDVLTAVRAGCWPKRADDHLQAHVAECPGCAEVVEVGSLLADEWEAARIEAQVPHASLVWWRAERRAREEAVREATWPVRSAHVVAVECVVVLLAALGWVGADWLLEQRAWLATFVSSLGVSPAELRGASTLLVSAVGLAVASSLVIAPVALYLAFARE